MILRYYLLNSFKSDFPVGLIAEYFRKGGGTGVVVNDVTCHAGAPWFSNSIHFIRNTVDLVI